jgi:hypothetical protein
LKQTSILKVEINCSKQNIQSIEALQKAENADLRSKSTEALQQAEHTAWG